MNPIGNPFIELSTVESSNNYATGQVQAQMAGHGYACFAHEQTKGKGQRGNSWTATQGENILLTTVIEPKRLKLADQFILSASVALACLDFFSAYASSETTIKWPNDLYWKDRKAGGILIENILQGSKWRFAIVGIGININQTSFPSSLSNAVSLKQITGKTYVPVYLAKELCNAIEARWKEIVDGAFDKVIEDYNACLYKRNQPVSFKNDQSTMMATVKGVSKNGALLVDNGIGTETAIKFGEWKWQI